LQFLSLRGNRTQLDAECPNLFKQSMLLVSGRELASRFQKLGSHLLKVLHFIPTAFAVAEHNRIWGSVVCSISDSTPKASSAGKPRRFPEPSFSDSPRPKSASALPGVVQGYPDPDQSRHFSVRFVTNAARPISARISVAAIAM
jgi:hypothetical protein